MNEGKIYSSTVICIHYVPTNNNITKWRWQRTKKKNLRHISSYNYYLCLYLVKAPIKITWKTSCLSFCVASGYILAECEHSSECDVTGENGLFLFRSSSRTACGVYLPPLTRCSGRLGLQEQETAILQVIFAVYVINCGVLQSLFVLFPYIFFYFRH